MFSSSFDKKGVDWLTMVIRAKRARNAVDIASIILSMSNKSFLVDFTCLVFKL